MPLVFSTTTASASSAESEPGIGTEIAVNATQDRTVTIDGSGSRI
ncbi:MAG: hypothetical protein O7G85_06605 [Planctomycetota bacterium]|nr:hypothetical protein [Planctomycetota bacterium]